MSRKLRQGVFSKVRQFEEGEDDQQQHQELQIADIIHQDLIQKSQEINNPEIPSSSSDEEPKKKERANFEEAFKKHLKVAIRVGERPALD